jgi:hypothetical protein
MSDCKKCAVCGKCKLAAEQHAKAQIVKVK